MQHLQDIKNSFSSFREQQFQKSSGITPDLLFEESMVQGVLSQLLEDMKVTVKTECALGDATNIPEIDSSSTEAQQKIEREEYNTQYSCGSLSAEQKIDLMSRRMNEQIRQTEYQGVKDYTQTIRSKYILVFAIFAISAKQQQESLSKDFFKQLTDYFQSCQPVEKRVEMGLNFASQFQLTSLTLLPTEEAKVQVLQKMYELLRQAADGELFGHDKLSFIIDNNLNQVSKYLQTQIVQSDILRPICLKLLMQLGRVRSNPADYLACITLRVDGQEVLVNLSSEMHHIYQDLKNIDAPSGVQSNQIETNKKFTESFSLNRGVLLYYKAGEHKLDITSQDQLVTDGKVLYHLNRGKGLFKLGVGDGVNKMSGIVKRFNKSEQIKSMEPCAMFVFNQKLYIRDYCQSPCPFQVFDCQTLDIDSELSEKWKLHFEQVLKNAQQVEAQAPEASADTVQEPQIHRSLLWHKDSKSGRFLEIAPMFTDDTFVYTVAYQKQIAADKPKMLVVETYDPNNDFSFVRSQILYQNDECEPFVYDQNSIQFLRSSQWVTNGQVLIVNVPNVNIYFFDLLSGKQIGKETSNHILISYSPSKNIFYTVRSINSNSVLHEVTFENIHRHQTQEVQNVQSFSITEALHIQQLIDISGLKALQDDQKESLLEQIVYGGLSNKKLDAYDIQLASIDQVQAQHTLILRYLDLKRAQAVSRLPTSDFIKVFKFQNVTYLTGSTFSVLINAATQFSSSPYQLLYVLRLLQCNFTALIMCQGSLPAIMRDYQTEYDSFFVLYNSVLRNKVYEKPSNPVEQEIQRVCIEIMASSINILYKSKQEIVDQFLCELTKNSDGVNCSIFFDYFSKVENCEKLLSKEITGTKLIFEQTCKVQLQYITRQLNDPKPSCASEQSSCKFLKLYAQRILIAYCDLLQKVSDRPAHIQKLPQQVQDKYAEEDKLLERIQSEVIAVYQNLAKNFIETLNKINWTQFSSDSKLQQNEAQRIRTLLLQKSPFAQLLVNIYSNVFTSIDLDQQLLPVVIDCTLCVLQTIQETKFKVKDVLQEQVSSYMISWLGSLSRTLAYLVSTKAYRLVKPEKVEKSQNSTVEQQLIQTSILSGGIEECYESEFSAQTQQQAQFYQSLWQKQQKESSSIHEDSILRSIIEPNEEMPKVQQAINNLQAMLRKRDMINSMTGQAAGLKLSLCAFASMLKLQDKVQQFQLYVDDQELLEANEIEQLFLMYQNANKLMRPWNHEIKNKISERIDNEVDQKFRKDKQAKLDQVSAVQSEVQIDTNQHQSFFTDEEQQLIKMEQERLFEIELQKLYDSVVDKAKYLIKLQPPQKIAIKKAKNQSDLLQTWRQLQKEKGNFKSMSQRQSEVMQATTKEIIKVLQLPCEVSRIVKQVEDVYLAAHKRAAGLAIFVQVLKVSIDCWSQQQFIDCIAWVTCALRDNKSIQVHYLDKLRGCGIKLEESIREQFFKILSYILKQIENPENTESEIEFFLNALRWRFTGRDHENLSQLQLFSTLRNVQKLSIHFGKPIQTDLEDQSSRTQLRFSFKKDAAMKAEIQKIFDRLDENKDGKLNYQECKDFYQALCDKFLQEFVSRHFDDIWNRIQNDNKVNFEVLYLEIQLKTQVSTLAKSILSLIEQLFSNTVSRLIESDIGSSLSVQGSTQSLQRAKSIINQTTSELLLGEMFEVIFDEFQRYINILKLQPGIDWTTYAQQRSKLSELIQHSVDEYQLLDIDLTAVKEVSSAPTDENKEDSKKIEDRAKQELSIIPRLYSESFLIRLIRLIDIFTTVSASNANLLAMVQRIANPQQLQKLLSLVVLASPRIKYLVIRILSSLITIKLPYELFEEAINLHLADTDSTIFQLFKKVQPTLKFKKSKFLAFLHQYILTIRQKVWIKSAVESEGQYEISVELFKLIRCIYESQDSDQHPWRQEINEVINTLFIEIKTLNRPREVEVLLSMIQGADFYGIAPYQKVEHGKEQMQILGFASHEWLKRQSGSHKIEETMRREDFAVLAVSSEPQGTLKLLPPSKVEIKEDQYSKSQWTLSVDLIKKLLGNLDLNSSNDTVDDVQQLNSRCMVLKLLNSQLSRNPNKFLLSLKDSGFYEQLLKFVCKESSLEIKGEIIPIEWLEQCCYNIRKMACENQLSLLKTQETQVKLVGDKLYATVLSPNSDNDTTYTRVKLTLAFNHKAFPQRKETKLVNGADIFFSPDEEQKVDHQVALLDPSDFNEGNGLQILNSSLGVITYDVDLHKLVQQIRDKNQVESVVDDFDQKAIFVVSREDYERLHTMRTAQTANKDANNDKQSFDDLFVDSLVKFGGYSKLVALKTKGVSGVEQKTKVLFDTIQKVNDGSLQLKEEETIQISNDTITSNVLAENQIENQVALTSVFKEIISARSDKEVDSQSKPIEGRFWRDTQVQAGSDLATLYQQKVKRLYNMYCRHIFWTLIQKDKIESMFEFLLTTPADTKSFVTFIKVVGNECFITANEQSIKNFKSFIKQVVSVSIQQQKFQPLLTMIINDVIDQYRKHLKVLTEDKTEFATLFLTESQASELMNPYIVLPIVKYTMNANGFAVLEQRLDELISIIMVINNISYKDYKLKDKLWHLIIKILDKCYDLSPQKIQVVCELPLLKALFVSFEGQNEDSQNETQLVQKQIQQESSDPNNYFKLAFQKKRDLQSKFLKYETKTTYTLTQLEVIYKFYKLAAKVGINFFFNNNLTSYIQLQSKLMEQQPDGPLSKHLYFMSTLTPEQQVIKTQHSTVDGELQLSNQDAVQKFIRVKDTTQIKLWQRLLITADREGQNVIASFTQNDIQKNYAFTSFRTKQAFVKITQPQQNFTVNLSQQNHQIVPIKAMQLGQIVQKQANKVFTKQGLFMIEEEQSKDATPIKNHLNFKQINFGKNCVIALLPNGTVIGFGQSKHRHFVDTLSHNSQQESDPIPLNVKPSETQQTVEEKQHQREIIMIQSFKRTTVCVTKTGQVYACGDKFAKNIKLSPQNPLPFGFYQLPVDLNKPQPPKVDPVQEKIEQPVQGEDSNKQEPEQAIADLFGDDEGVQPAQEDQVVQPSESEVAQVQQEQPAVQDSLEPVLAEIAEEEEKKNDQSFKSADSGDDGYKSSKSQEEETALQTDQTEELRTLSHSPHVTNLIEQVELAQQASEVVALDSIVLDVAEQNVIEAVILADNIEQEMQPDVVQESNQVLAPSQEERDIEKEQRDIEREQMEIEQIEQEQMQIEQEEAAIHQMMIDHESQDDEYIPQPDTEQVVKQEEPTEVVNPGKAEQVWISNTSSSKYIVILALFKTQEGTYQFRTVGNNPSGLLGQGKDVKESNELRLVDFGVPLVQIDQVVVGLNHFIVRADGKVYAWGCYKTESEEKLIWKPTELSFFNSYKVKSMQSGDQVTAALVEQIGAADYFIYGKFTPLWSENSYKTIKEISADINPGFIIERDQLVFSVNQSAVADLSDSKIEIETSQDFGFECNSKIYEANQQAHTKFEGLLALSDAAKSKKSELISAIMTYIFSRVKDNQFEDITWKDISADELKIDNSLGLSEEQKIEWLLLVVNYCRNMWGHLTYIGGNISKIDSMEIIQNFIKNRANVPMCIKNKLLKMILQGLPKDEAREHISIHIARLRAKELKAEGKVDSKFEWSVFSKVSEQLRKAGFKGMRQNTQQSRAWFVKFIGESSNDDGGLFRESITELCIELQSQSLELFLPCGNQASKVGDNRDCWVINPKATGKLHLRKYYFIGCLFGMCVRSGILMNLNMAPIFWKRLTGEQVSERDISAIDFNFMQNLDQYRKFRDEGNPEQSFIEAFQLTMQGLNSAGDLVELVENGSKVQVTYANLDQYINGCIKLRLTESKLQYKSIVEGFDQIFKASYLKMISWNDLELKVVGNEEIDIDRLKDMTQYKNCNASHDVVKRFWKVLQSFDNEDKKRYLRFVWARMRLPQREETDIEQHTVELVEKAKKDDLPFGRTCYFRIELPPYQSEEVLRQKLLYALYNTGSIDGDHNNASQEEPVQDERHSDSENSEDEDLRNERERYERVAAQEASRLRQNEYGDESGGGEEE